MYQCISVSMLKKNGNSSVKKHSKLNEFWWIWCNITLHYFFPQSILQPDDLQTQLQCFRSGSAPHCLHSLRFSTFSDIMSDSTRSVLCPQVWLNFLSLLKRRALWVVGKSLGLMNRFQTLALDSTCCILQFHLFLLWNSMILMVFSAEITGLCQGSVKHTHTNLLILRVHSSNIHPFVDQAPVRQDEWTKAWGMIKGSKGMSSRNLR